jgi:hypothetical protein
MAGKKYCKFHCPVLQSLAVAGRPDHADLKGGIEQVCHLRKMDKKIHMSNEEMPHD